MRGLSLLTALAVLFGGCATFATPQARRDNPPPKNLAAQKKAEDAAIATLLQNVKPDRGGDYRISSPDLIQITVYREDDMSRTVRVSQEGMISFPLIGDIKVGGLSVIQAEDQLGRKLADYLVNPQVTIFIKEYGNKQIYVLGEVQKPGTFELPTESHLTVLEAISMAGGFTQVAAKDRTRVIRATPDGKSESLTVAVSAITQQGEKDKDIPLAPNDVVYVPQSFF